MLIFDNMPLLQSEKKLFIIKEASVSLMKSLLITQGIFNFVNLCQVKIFTFLGAFNEIYGQLMPYASSICLIGIDVAAHDIRFVEDNWESPVICHILSYRLISFLFLFFFFFFFVCRDACVNTTMFYIIILVLLFISLLVKKIYYWLVSFHFINKKWGVLHV